MFTSKHLFSTAQKLPQIKQQLVENTAAGPRRGCLAAARTAFWSDELAYGWHYRLLPGVQQAPQQYNLAGVVGSVVADKQGFTENGLAGAMRQGYQQIGALGLQ